MRAVLRQILQRGHAAGETGKSTQVAEERCNRSRAAGRRPQPLAERSRAGVFTADEYEAIGACTPLCHDPNSIGRCAPTEQPQVLPLQSIVTADNVPFSEDSQSLRAIIHNSSATNYLQTNLASASDAAMPVGETHWENSALELQPVWGTPAATGERNFDKECTWMDPTSIDDGVEFMLPWLPSGGVDFMLDWPASHMERGPLAEDLWQTTMVGLAG